AKGEQLTRTKKTIGVELLEAKQLTKKYGERPALDALDLQIAPGEVYCLVGANGAGKTTTISLFLNFISPTSGAAFVNGICIAEQPALAKSHLAYIPETVSLYGQLSGMENLDYFSTLAGHRLSREDKLALLDRVRLRKEDIGRRAVEYSKGMRQKVGIAIALAKNASAILMDEPTSGLDPQAANELSTLVKQLGEQQTTVLMATHDLYRAKEIASNIGIMKQGRLVETVKPGDVSHAELESIALRNMQFQ
ncbi:MAG: ABC transporter ATP-binding protein, partial [Planctomycetota bacterium]